MCVLSSVVVCQGFDGVGDFNKPLRPEFGGREQLGYSVVKTSLGQLRGNVFHNYNEFLVSPHSEVGL